MHIYFLYLHLSFALVVFFFFEIVEHAFQKECMLSITDKNMCIFLHKVSSCVHTSFICSTNCARAIFRDVARGGGEGILGFEPT